jgi:SM-20-related protein
MHIAEIADQLEHTGYIILENPLLDNLSAQLFIRCHDDAAPSIFHAAHVGRGTSKKLIRSLRGDVINWLDASNSIDQAYLLWMEELRLGLNAALYLGLFDFECHYAVYGAGDGYAKHSDVLVGKRNRILSTVLYLNEDWQACDGGELVVYESTGKSIIATVNPTFGRMIIFLSDAFPHEVLVSHKTRRSIAGWFRASDS